MIGMADEVKMVVIDGVRYRPEDAEKIKKAEPKNKSRTTVSNKSAAGSGDKG